MTLSPEKQANDALALIWLMETAGIRCFVDRGAVVVRGAKESPMEELLGLLRPYKAAICAYLDALQLNKAVRDDITTAYDIVMGDG